MYCDAHLHFVDLEEREPLFAATVPPFPWTGAVVSHDPDEFSRSEVIRAAMPQTIAGFGIHPQNPDMRNAGFLSTLCDEKRIRFIGEAGFDFFGDGPLRSRAPEAMRLQTEAFLFQARLAAHADLPLVIHLRKATDICMAYGRELRLVPSVIFHCWPGRYEEAKMLLGKGINAYFSFGTPLLRDSRHAIESLAGLPPSRILSETDAPWQPPHGSAWTRLGHIVDVVAKMASVLGLKPRALEALLEKNFAAAYLLNNSRSTQKEQIS